MLRVIASLVGSGAGAIMIGVIFVASLHLSRVPEAIKPMVRRVMIVGMYAGGSAIAVTEAGTWWADIANRVAGWFGGFGAGVPKSVLVIASALLVLGLVVGLIFAPVEAVIVTAAIVPAVIMLVPGGALHSFYVQTTIPARQMAESFSTWIAG